jgi:hypothetical protein
VSSSCLAVYAQGTAQISGTVKDQSGAVLPGVEVSATQTDTGIARTTLTNETGSYVLPNLAIGPYRLEAALAGFRTFVQSGIVLQVNANPVINPTLEVGQVSEQVEVQANAALVETRSSGVGQVIENQRILDLPLNGRNVTDLIALSGATVQTGTSSTKNFGGTPVLSVAGGIFNSVGYTLDGANHYSFAAAGSMPMPFPDALQEFKVDTAGLTAQQGGAGAAVSAVTKSGTNDLHGDLFEFVRNDLFNATQYFAAANPATGNKVHSTLKRNQFGGTAGGAIVKNRLFFFGGYQGTTIRQDAANQQAFLPTPAMLAGDWTTFTSPACNAGRQVALRAPFVNNRIDPSLYSKAAVNLVTRVLSKSPKTNDPCGLLIYGQAAPENDWQTLGRIDYQVNAKQSVFGRYLVTHASLPSPYLSNPVPMNSTVSGLNDLAQSFVFGHTYLAGPNAVNAFRLSAGRVWAVYDTPQIFSACDVGVNTYCGYLPQNMVLSITNGFSMGLGHRTGDVTGINTFQINDDFSLVRGAHQMSFGGNPRLDYFTQSDFFFGVGRFTFSGATTGTGLADILTGNLATLSAGAPLYMREKQWLVSAYATDTWKMTPRLTMNYGVRWEPFIPQTMLSGQTGNFSYDRFHKGIESVVLPNAPFGWYYPGDPGFPGLSGSNTGWAQFAPRIGFAWDVNGDGRTSVRASYGYGHATTGAHWRSQQTQDPPWVNVTAVSSPQGGFDNPWSGYPGGIPFPLKTGTQAQFNNLGDYTSFPYDLKTPATSSWNFSLQRQIGANWLVSGSYIGSATTHIWTLQPINYAPFVPGATAANTNQRRILNLERPSGIQMQSVMNVDPSGTQNYHGMLLTVARRVMRGINMNANYTLSHCIGDYNPAGTGNGFTSNTWSDPLNRAADRGDCDGDRRQIFNLTSVAQTPQFASRPLRTALSGWTLSGVYKRSSGSPLNILAGSDRALTGIFDPRTNGQVQRAQQISGNPYTDQSGSPLTNWLNRSSFDVPALGTLGNYRRNSVVGPPSWSFDMSLSRAFRFRESQQIEFRADAFNVTNSFRPGNPNTSLTNTQFGQIRTALDPRILQFALKYVF